MDVIVQPTPDKMVVTSHRQYNTPGHLTPTAVLSCPLEQFRHWFKEAQGPVSEPEAMSVSTVNAAGVPSSRFVLLKQVDARGFVFFTNYTSRKSNEITENGHAALALYWREVHRQVRVVGRVERVSAEESDEYFRSRPIGSRLGAWASPQSQVVGEEELQHRLEEVRTRFELKDDEAADADIPRPEFWGGWRVIPDEVEFWAGKPSRLHDRVRYKREGGSANEWKIERLAP